METIVKNNKNSITETKVLNEKFFVYAVECNFNIN